MKKNIVKIIIGLMFVVGAIVSFNVVAYASCANQGSYNNGHCAQGDGGSFNCVEKDFYKAEIVSELHHRHFK